MSNSKREGNLGPNDPAYYAPRERSANEQPGKTPIQTEEWRPRLTTEGPPLQPFGKPRRKDEMFSKAVAQAMIYAVIFGLAFWGAVPYVASAHLAFDSHASRARLGETVSRRAVGRSVQGPVAKAAGNAPAGGPSRGGAGIEGGGAVAEATPVRGPIGRA